MTPCSPSTLLAGYVQRFIYPGNVVECQQGVMNWNWALIIALLIAGRLGLSGIEPTRFNIWFAVATLVLAVSVPVFPFVSRAITRAIRQHTIPAISANAGRRRFLFQSVAVAVGIVSLSAR